MSKAVKESIGVTAQINERRWYQSDLGPSFFSVCQSCCSPVFWRLDETIMVGYPRQRQVHYFCHCCGLGIVFLPKYGLL